MMWDPEQYLMFGDQRARPFHELLARIGAQHPRRVVDLGCGPGTLTQQLIRRWPDAIVEAVDSSAEMVAAARERGVAAEVADVRDWRPRPDTDVLISNAVLHWVPEHGELLRQWAAALPVGGWLAVQVPGNFGGPSHELIRMLAASPRWRTRLAGALPRGAEPVRPPDAYADLLADAGFLADAWETTYVQRMTGSDPVLEWITGTALRPVMAALSEDDWQLFRAELGPLLRDAYPPRADGVTWFPFRRIFVVATKTPDVPGQAATHEPAAQETAAAPAG